ncbi:unnamed protein product [Anisakis simplex]|uniref:Cyanate hydratase n=1 Tax=Anisakis simplex TaxID=6269 RepID=A0A0M3K6L2_ANISI|nr:unnamed protein product [Anisakis simplex]
MVKSREDITNKIMIAKVEKGLTWSQIAAALGKSKEWATAACLGQMQMSKEQAQIARKLFDLSQENTAWLQMAPYKGSTGTSHDPLIYRLNEVISVYGDAIKELIHEEFGDGIMSAIDFTLKVEREQCDEGDRVRMIWSGKFLPYKSF